MSCSVRVISSLARRCGPRAGLAPCGRGPTLPILLGPEHGQKLPPARYQLAEQPLFRLFERSRRGPDPRGVHGDHLGIEPVGFGEAADRASESAEPLRVDHRDRQPSFEESSRKLHLQGTGGLEDNKPDVQTAEMGDHTSDAADVVR
jgi:hypothetical protein